MNRWKDQVSNLERELAGVIIEIYIINGIQVFSWVELP